MIIEVRNLWKEYGDKVILERLNLKVKEGEFITLIGSSGCGKSTFLKMLLGVESPTRGQILLDGKAIPVEPGPDRGVVFQQYSVFPHLTVVENVITAKAFAKKSILGRLFGAEYKHAKKEAEMILQEVGLSHVLQRYPDELSGGMKQRLAIAQTLLSKPRILLLDEPFGALDPGIRADMHELVLRLWKEYKLTIFMVTHDLKEGFYLGNRVLVFDKTRADPQEPDAYGSSITYDLPTGVAEHKLAGIQQNFVSTEPVLTQ
ncbi:MAG TPA: lauroyl acyltransferase [Pasteurellaceae bacterium]|nr:lauroyl acyltransferase [Pasteurellaceae bacterium]